LEQYGIELDHGPDRRMHGELCALTDELVAGFDCQPLRDLTKLLPRLWRVFVGIDTDFLEMLGIDPIREGVEPGRQAIHFVVLDHAAQRGSRMIVREAVKRGIAQALHVEGREQVLVKPDRHEEVKSEKALRGRPCGEADADLLPKLAGREALGIHLDVRMGLVEKSRALLIPRGLRWVIVGPDCDCQGTLRLRRDAPPKGRDAASSYTCGAN